MSRKEMLSLMKGYDQSNDDDYAICRKCPCDEAIIIENKKPLTETLMEICSKCPCNIATCTKREFQTDKIIEVFCF